MYIPVTVIKYRYRIVSGYPKPVTAGILSSFMPPKMLETIVQAGRERSQYYENQRVDPHYLHPSGGEYIFMRSELDDKVTDQMRRCAKVTSVTELLSEADDTLSTSRATTALLIIQSTTTKISSRTQFTCSQM